MEKEVIGWDELLEFEEFHDFTDEYGDYTQEIVNCFETLDTVSWFQYAGSDAPAEFDVTNITTWGDAIAPIIDRRNKKYDVTGHLKDPVAELDPWRRKRNTGKDYRAAAKDVVHFVDYHKYVPAFLEKPEREFLLAHIGAFVDNLLVEVISQEFVESTHFRELLSWFEAGFFPCGWEGQWPDGRLRVF